MNDQIKQLTLAYFSNGLYMSREKIGKNNNNSVGNSKKQKGNNQIPIGIIWGGIRLFFLMLVVGILITKKRKKRK